MSHHNLKMSRRLPVYLLLDTSGSMVGEPIESVKNGVQVLLSSLRQDPHALETAYISVITFNSSAQQLIPLTEIATFQVPNFNASGTTALGEALSLTARCIEREVKKSTHEVKGDWKPLVFIMTDGEPTDDFERGLRDFNLVSKGIVVACAVGDGARKDLLTQITTSVVSLSTADHGSISAYFKWVSSSISVGSQKVDGGAGDVGGLSELPPPPPEIVIENI